MIRTNKDELLIGVISDTHVPHKISEISQEVIGDFKRRKVDYVFHLGDFTSYQAYQKLATTFRPEHLIAIHGNMDFDKKLRRELPEKIEMEILGHKILMVHGMGGPDGIVDRLIKKLNLLSSKYDIVIFGHTHRPLNEIRNKILFFNPGTTTKNYKDPSFSGSYGYLVISKNKIEPEIVYF
ncbi:MAG: metallophosphoesterase family protein [Candidatus Hodarchaeota archaeon]